MGFNVIIKLIKEALGIIIIVAAVILFSYLDPFGWFNPKPKIQGTAILLREVKAIGELITAEYYGEALTSWPKVFEESAFEEDSTDIQRILTGINSELDDGNPEGKDEKGRPIPWASREIWKYYKKHVREHYHNSNLYDLIINEASKGGNKFNKERKAILAIYEKADEEIFNKNQIRAISESRKRSRIEKRKDAVCIGRGIVRAGIDLSNVKENDISIFDHSQTAYISNVTLKIIAVELNPWFIPQKKVRGFEILKLKGRIDGEDIHLLKSKCKELIEKQANDRKILAEAKKNAEEALLSFFNLIRKEPLKRVRIITDTLEELQIRFDSLRYLTPLQAVELYNKSFSYVNNRLPGDTNSFAVEKDSLKTFLQRMRKKPVQFEVANKDPKAPHLKVATLALDAYQIKAILQHFKLPLASDTARNKYLPERNYLRDYWLEKSTPTLDSIELADRIQRLETLFNAGL
jgi:hypothetical protein